MCPKIAEFGPFTIYSYGLMLAIGFLTASYFLTQELKRKKLDQNLAGTITILALIGGIVGSKILYLFEHWSQFTADPIGMAFSPSGLTFYGGFIMALVIIYLYLKKRRISFFSIADAVAPGLLLGYGIARLGCHFAGDGDYGFPTTLPWGTDYSNGTYPPSQAFRGFPEITSQYPNGIVPDSTLCHPTPVYELLIAAGFFLILWRFRSILKPDGRMFMLYLILAGTERFVVEFLRINQRILFGLSEAQLIAGVMIIVGVVGFWYIPKRIALAAR